MPKTYNDIYIDIRNKLREHGIENNAFEARQIICFASGKANSQFLKDMNFYSSQETEDKAFQMMNRRINGEPLAYIIGAWEFYGLPFFVSRDVLIPRIDTEVLVSASSELLQMMPNARILDLCCGSGCISCALAHEHKDLKVVAVDISGAALQICRKNVKLNKLNPRVICIQSDVKQTPPNGMGTFDLIVSNPPYIPTKEILTLDSSVKDFEPSWALDGGESGLDFYHSIIDLWTPLLKSGGYLLFEVGEDQAGMVSDLIPRSEFKSIYTKKDTIGVDRVVIAEKY